MVCTEDKPFDAKGERLHVFANGRLLVDVGHRGKEHWLADARVFDAEKVVKRVSNGAN